MFKILDCSLRDGGYYTNWDFAQPFVAKYFDAIRNLPIDFVEVGYRSPPTGGYKGQYFYMSVEDIQTCKESLREDQKMAIMFNVKDCTPSIVDELISPCADTVDIVRFACPPTSLDKGIELAEIVSSHGIEVAMNVMYLDTYIFSPDKLAPLQSAGKSVQYIALVDSYGGCFPNDVRALTEIISRDYPQEIGFHGHDNITLAFANALAALDGGATIIDGTLSGMGRGAGNLTTELICAYKERVSNAEVDYTSLSNILADFQSMKEKHAWGTSLPYIVSGMSGLPQAEVMDWLGKRRYTPSSIVGALRGQAARGLDQAQYDRLADKKHELGLSAKAAIIIGGGESVKEHAPAINRFVTDTEGVVIHSSLRNSGVLNGGGNLRQTVCLSGQEYANLGRTEAAEIEANTVSWVVASAPRLSNSTPARGKIVQVDLPEEFEEGKLGPVSDIAPLELALSAAMDLDVQEIFLCGFDGYQNASAAEVALMSDVQKTIDWFDRLHPNVKIVSLLPTQYNIPVESLYARPVSVS